VNGVLSTPAMDEPVTGFTATDLNAFRGIPSADADRRAVETFGEVLADIGRPLVTASGAGGLAQGPGGGQTGRSRSGAHGRRYADPSGTPGELTLALASRLTTRPRSCLRSSSISSKIAAAASSSLGGPSRTRVRSVVGLVNCGIRLPGARRRFVRLRRAGH
jgi:hypothetical protein